MERSTDATPLQQFIQRMDRPLLYLAVVAVLLYMLSLVGLFDNIPNVYWCLSLLIDLVFVIDLSLKLIAFGSAYVFTPWFLIDFLSCIPVLDTVGAGLQGTASLRFVRALRMFRILRALRVLRVLKSMPVFQRMVEDQGENKATSTRFSKALSVGVILFSLVFLVLVIGVHRTAQEEFVTAMQLAVDAGADVSQLGGSVDPLDEPALIVESQQGNEYYFALDEVETWARTSELFLLVGTVVTMALFMFLMNLQLRDVSYSQLHSLLNIALPRQVVDEFMRRPQSYAEKSRESATILFMDFVGFTRTCEKFATDVDLLAKNLEMVMDRVVDELNEHDMIIDKFIGDAIMCFRGGPLVKGTAEEHAYRAVRGALAATKALRDLENPYFSSLKIGGASATQCLIGAFGTSTRLSYTTLGDGVNLAARLEPASGQCQTDNLFCSTTYELCSPKEDIAWRRWGQIRVPGKKDPIHVYEAFDTHALGQQNFLTHFAQGLDEFERREFSKAREQFLTADKARTGGDRASQHYIHWCEELLTHGLDDDWEPVLRTKK